MIILKRCICCMLFFSKITQLDKSFTLQWMCQRREKENKKGIKMHCVHVPTVHKNINMYHKYGIIES